MSTCSAKMGEAWAGETRPSAAQGDSWKGVTLVGLAKRSPVRSLHESPVNRLEMQKCQAQNRTRSQDKFDQFKIH